MKTIGIICEYNPFHLGHQKQMDLLREAFPDGRIVCLMSGNFVQRGVPAVLDKSLRARAAAECGADLVLEMPVQYALSSAEGFARGGVEILAPFCDVLSFGTESGTPETLMTTARALLSPEFSRALRPFLEAGLSFPAARQRALAQMGIPDSLLESPNDILGVEYCKAILSLGTSLEIFPIPRLGSYHNAVPDPQNPSATAVRGQMLKNLPWQAYVPEPARKLFAQAPLHSLAAGERAVLARLRTMTDEEFEALPYGSEGLWRRLMHAARREARLEDIAAAVKSKRYTRSRIDRMILCAFLGLTREFLERPPDGVRVLAFRDTGRAVLKRAKETGSFFNAGELSCQPETDRRLDALYSLFREDLPGPPDGEQTRRIYYHRTGA